MTPKNLEVNNYFPTDIVPPDQQHLHILQMALNLNPIPITGNTNAEILLQVQNLVQLEKFCGFLPIGKGTKAPPFGCKYAGEPHLTLEQALGFKPAALGIRSSNLLTLDYDQESSFDFVAERGIDFTFPTTHIRRTDQGMRFKQVFYVPDKKLLEIPNGFIPFRKINYEKAGLDVFLSNAGYIIFSGLHEDKKGFYYSPKGLDWSNLAEVPNKAWDLVLEISEKEKVKGKTKSYSLNCKSRRLNPCPICYRDKRLWCSESDNGLIWCFKGQNFSAELSHGILNIGDVVNGYALVATNDTCNTFKLDQPPKRKHKPRRTTLKRRVVNVRR